MINLLLLSNFCPVISFWQIQNDILTNYYLYTVWSLVMVREPSCQRKRITLFRTVSFLFLAVLILSRKRNETNVRNEAYLSPRLWLRLIESVDVSIEYQFIRVQRMLKFSVYVPARLSEIDQGPPPGKLKSRAWRLFISFVLLYFNLLLHSAEMERGQFSWPVERQ